MTEQQPLLLIGAGGHARSVIDIIEQAGRYQIVGLIDQPSLKGKTCLGYPIIGSDMDLPDLLINCRNAFIAIGQIGGPGPRLRLHEELCRLHAAQPIIISPRSIVSRHASVGDGSLVGHAAIINAGARIGKNAIINTRALIEHDVHIGDHCHIATAAVVNGGTLIEDGCFIGSGAVLREGIHIGAGSFIGAGALVTRDCPPNSIVKRSS